MLPLLITLILSQVNASNPIPKDGLYKYDDLGIEIEVEKGEATFARIHQDQYQDQVPLTKKEEGFYGEWQSKETVISFTIIPYKRRSLIVTMEKTVFLPKKTESILYNFKEIGIKLFIENNLISKFYTGLEETSKSSTELELNKNGTIASYAIYSRESYLLKAENSQIKEFWCDNCEYKIGPAKDSIVVSEDSYAVFKPNTIEMYNCDGIKKVIRTNDGKDLNIDIFFYKDSDLISGATQFSVGKDQVIYQNSSKFITRKSL
jgi:hypothetical protein